MNYIICGALAAGYFADFLKGRKTLAFVTLFIGIMAVELCACSLAYRQNKASILIKFYSMAGYMLIYCFAMFASDTYFTFVYIFPMTVLYILYYDTPFIKLVGACILTTNIVKIIYQIQHGNTGDTDITSYMVQISCVGIYSAGMYFVTRLSVSINDEKVEKILEINKSLEKANQSKTTFLATMSHEIRTPMNAIIGIAQIQLNKGNLPEEQETALEKIHTSGNTLLAIINDILDMSKIETGKMELHPVNYDAASLINDTVQLNIVRIGSKPIEFILDVDPQLPSRMYGDELRLKQILNNLLSNAIKYTDKGHVKLSVNHLSLGYYIHLRFVVEDTGQGMKPEDKQKLFCEYLRFNKAANRATEGTGLGLSISKRLAAMMEGDIHVQSEYGKGSTFTVSLIQHPVECEAIGPELSRQLRNFTFARDRRLELRGIKREPMPYGRVLVVDDVETNLYVAEGLLSAYELTIETAISGFAAINKVESGKTYDIIFMDHMMPQMDGIQTVHKLREMGYDGVIVALTANALVGNDEMFLQNGFQGFVAKPIDTRILHTVLNKFVRNRHPEESAKYKTYQDADKADAAKAPPAQTHVVNPKLLEVFCKDAKKASSTLRETTAQDDLGLFTITVHAMKSALANIGEKEAAATAYELEKAGRIGDKAFISTHAEDFVRLLESLIAKCKPPETTSDDTDICEDIAHLAQQLLEVKTACDDYDYTNAYARLTGLKEMKWAKETAAALSQMCDLLFLQSDFEAVSEQAAQLLSRLPSHDEQQT